MTTYMIFWLTADGEHSETFTGTPADKDAEMRRILALPGVIQVRCTK